MSTILITGALMAITGWVLLRIPGLLTLGITWGLLGVGLMIISALGDRND